MNAELNIVERSFEFAVRVVRLCRFLEKQDRVSRTLANQLLRSGTSVGANIEEALSKLTLKDPIHESSLYTA